MPPPNEACPTDATAPSARLKKLFDLLGDVDSTQGWIVKAATAGPIVQYLAGWAPPWPEKQFALALGCAVLQVLAAMWALTFWAKKRKLTARKAFAVATLAFLALAAAYVFLFARDTLVIPLNGSRVVTGRDYKEFVAEFIDEEYGGDLAKAIHDRGIENIYEPAALVRNRVTLCLLFFAVYLALSLGMTAFTTLNKPAPPAAPQKPPAKAP